MDCESQYKIAIPIKNALVPITADDVFSMLNSFFLVLTLILTQFSIRFKQKLSEDELDKIDFSNKIFTLCAALIPLCYGLFHLWAWKFLNKPLVAGNRMFTGMALIASAISLIITASITVNRKVKELNRKK